MSILGSLCFCTLLAGRAQDLERVWFPVEPGAAQHAFDGNLYRLSNRVLSLTLDKDGTTATFENLLDHTKATIDLPKLSGGGFGLGLKAKDRTAFQAKINPDAASTMAGRHVGGWSVHIGGNVGLGYSVETVFELRDGANYISETLEIKRAEGYKDDGTAARIDLVGMDAANAKVVGTVPGSPIVAGNIFAGAEYPMAVSQIAGGHAESFVERKVPIAAGSPVRYGAVYGVAPAGQMRRAVLRYVERERAHPYRAFLHYNSWYDLGYFTPYTSDQCVERINTFGQALTVKRGVKLSSFLFDDGWDDYKGVWKFSKDFPNGFLPLKEAAAKYDAGPGVWLSPWGGYAGPRKIRLEAGKAQGYEVDSQGYALSGPKYFQRFRDVTLDFVKDQGINQFKFDGTGSPDKQYPGSKFDSDFGAAISLIGDLRAASPNLFVNLTTGTWPSPFWLKIADSTWRGGEDHSFAGVGPFREQWITYRDGDTYNGVVRRGPLYPINSLMLHGIIYAQHAFHLNTDPSDDFRNDVRAYFATGTQLQEMYVTPSLLTEQNWDDLAEAAKWAQTNADVLVDTHWVGGDPTKLEVYGHAAWMGGKGILELRNPSDKPQAYSVDIARELQLPNGARGVFKAHSPFKENAREPEREFNVGGSNVVVLKPFEVLVLEGEVK